MTFFDFQATAGRSVQTPSPCVKAPSHPAGLATWVQLANKPLTRALARNLSTISVRLGDSQVTTRIVSIQAFFYTVFAKDWKGWITWGEGGTYVPAGSPHPDSMTKAHSREGGREGGREGADWVPSSLVRPWRRPASEPVLLPATTITLNVCHADTHGHTAAHTPASSFPNYNTPQVLTTCRQSPHRRDA